RFETIFVDERCRLLDFHPLERAARGADSPNDFSDDRGARSRGIGPDDDCCLAFSAPMTEEKKHLTPEELRSWRWFGPNDLRSFGHRSRARQMGLGPEDWAG